MWKDFITISIYIYIYRNIVLLFLGHVLVLCVLFGSTSFVFLTVVLVPPPCCKVVPNSQWRRNEFESGGGAPVRYEIGGNDPALSVGKNFLVVPLHFFGYKSTISRFGERFRDGQYSSVSFLYPVLLLKVPPCPAICKSRGTTCSTRPMDSAPLQTVI